MYTNVLDAFQVVRWTERKSWMFTCACVCVCVCVCVLGRSGVLFVFCGIHHCVGSRMCLPCALVRVGVVECIVCGHFVIVWMRGWVSLCVQ